MQWVPSQAMRRLLAPERYEYVIMRKLVIFIGLMTESGGRRKLVRGLNEIVFIRAFIFL